MSRDLSTFAPWIDWPVVIAKIRKAKTDERAIETAKRNLSLAMTLFEQITRGEIEQGLKVERIAALARERVAIAMAREGNGAKWKDHLAEAKVLDAAIRARRPFEI